jgi:tetratricopeptide (TPR) repeat protein
VVLNQLFKLNEDYLPGVITASLVARDLDQAKEMLAFAARAVYLAPKSAHAHVALANALLAVNRDAEAVDALQTAIQHDPRNAELHVQLGDVLLMNLNRPEEAIDHYQSACKLSPTFVSAYVRLTQMLVERGNTTEAAETLGMIKKLEPNHPALAILKAQIDKIESGKEPITAKDETDARSGRR